MYGLEYELARQRHRQLRAEAETYRLQRRIGRRTTRRRAVQRTAVLGVCLATAIVLIVAATQGQW